MKKRIKSTIYTEGKFGKGCREICDTDNPYLYSHGRYPTKIIAAEKYSDIRNPRIAKRMGVWYSKNRKRNARYLYMDTAKVIKELREGTGMTRKEFSEHTGIPVRTLEDWEADRRRPPEYIPRLLSYQIKFEGIFAENKESKEKRNVSVIKDVDGNNIVIINDIRFKGKRSIKWKDVREYLKEYVGEFYTIAATGDVIYIGPDLPKEYSGSKYTNSLKGTNSKAKANAATGIPEMIEIAVGKHFRENHKDKHKRDAKKGWYRYDSRFALPVYDDKGELERYNIFHASMLVRHSNDGKLYLYDVIDIKKETSNSLGE